MVVKGLPRMLGLLTRNLPDPRHTAVALSKGTAAESGSSMAVSKKLPEPRRM